MCGSKFKYTVGQKIGCNQFKLVFYRSYYIFQNERPGNCDCKRTGLWFSPVQFRFFSSSSNWTFKHQCCLVWGW
ncbi:hypothetical protein L208DRAFT_1235537 [Tricholoma matsutake]|nr:hypothetical protein L208DRAFT_1235537 [Tricholoma matsutake 945]